MPVEFGLALPDGPEPGVSVSTFVEALDIALPRLQPFIKSLWMTDHFFWGTNPVYEAWTVLAYLAARYPDVQVAPMVLGQSYRNPATLAKMASTLQALSGGRFIMGIGAGWKEDEYHAYGYDYPRAGIRLEQLEDTLEIFKRMLEEPGASTYEGKHYHIRDAINEPKPNPRIPIVVGGGGEKTMRLAARFADMWNLPDAKLPAYSEKLHFLDQACADIERDPKSLRRTWFGRIVVGRTEGEAEQRGLAGASSGKWTRDNAFVGTPEQIVDEMHQFVAAGCDYFMVEILGLPDDDVFRMMTEEIMPQVTAFLPPNVN